MINTSTKQIFDDVVLNLLSRDEQKNLEQILEGVQNGQKNAFFLAYSRLNIFSKSLARVNFVKNPFPYEIDFKQWNIVEFLRVYCILYLPVNEGYQKTLDQLIQFADYKERIAYYKGLVFYPEIDGHYQRVRDGLRNSIQSVFEGICIYNPYPMLYLKQDAWNQMVLKALFLGVNINLIYGLEDKANAILRDMLIQYAQERVAASRRVDPRLWRCVGLYLTAHILPILEQALSREDQAEQLGVALALYYSKLERAKDLLNQHQSLKEKLKTISYSWESIKWENLYYDKSTQVD